MTINVTTPDGGTVAFPEGTDANTINSVMAEHFGGGKTADAAAAPSSIGVNNLVRSAAEGIPVLGGLANKANAAINAGLAPVMNPLFAEKDQLKGGSFGERYAESLATQEGMSKKFEAEHPIASTAANITGGVAATLPLAATATGARLLGLTGRTLPAQVAQGAASGAGINAADAAVRGENPLTAGMVGGAIGGAAPAVARGVGALAAPVVNTVRGIINPTEEAARRIAVAGQRDIRAGTAGLGDADFAAAQAAGQPVMAMDQLGETGRAPRPEARPIHHRKGVRFSTRRSTADSRDNRGGSPTGSTRRSIIPTRRRKRQRSPPRPRRSTARPTRRPSWQATRPIPAASGHPNWNG